VRLAFGDIIFAHDHVEILAQVEVVEDVAEGSPIRAGAQPIVLSPAARAASKNGTRPARGLR
jgi:hypothetical protein